MTVTLVYAKNCSDAQHLYACTLFRLLFHMLLDFAKLAVAVAGIDCSCNSLKVLHRSASVKILSRCSSAARKQPAAMHPGKNSLIIII